MRLKLLHCLPLLFASCLSFFLTTAAFSEEKAFVIVIPSYNNKDWYQPNLDSVLRQNYENYRVIYLDDNSPDGTGGLVADYLLEKDAEHRVTLIQNKQRVGALANIYSAVWMCDPSEIVVTLDGDDWFYGENVLQILSNAYSDPNVWMTYGQYDSYPSGAGFGARELPWWVIADRCYRSYDWVTTHLRTFYAGLFQKINREDLLYDGKFFSVTWDLAFMFPMLEMSATHSRYIPYQLYVYNVATPLNDNKLHRDLQRHLENVIRAKDRYDPIESPY
ncbi:MAG: glycosyltransferase family 2 protein [Verrucomicrobia bacterium]|nr:glycosyltransferase family 2 protein [Verrucomicrobiota bacterium]